MDNLFGTADENIVSRITSITIRGKALGTPNSVSATDHFGFVAQQIGSLKVGERRDILVNGAANVTLRCAVGVTGDLRVRLVAF